MLFQEKTRALDSTNSDTEVSFQSADTVGTESDPRLTIVYATAPAALGGSLTGGNCF